MNIYDQLSSLLGTEVGVFVDGKWQQGLLTAFSPSYLDKIEIEVKPLVKQDWQVGHWAPRPIKLIAKEEDVLTRLRRVVDGTISYLYKHEDTYTWVMTTTRTIPKETEVSEQSPRDTHFVGFAKAVIEEMPLDELYMLDGYDVESVSSDMRAQLTAIIARRAYDLAAHILNNMPSSAAAYEAPEVIKWISDLPELPEVGE